MTMVADAQDKDEREDIDELGESWRKPACEYGMSGWCGQLRKHTRCYFTTAEGAAAARAGTYGRADGHQWICACPCHVPQSFPPCPHPDHAGHHERQVADVDHPIQLGLF